MTTLSRRSFLVALGAAVPGCRALRRETAPADLLGVARSHVALSHRLKGDGQLWGRLGGSEAERASAELLAEQLRPWVDEVRLVPVAMEATRPRRWSATLGPSGEAGALLASAVPAPFDARFPVRVGPGPIVSLGNGAGDAEEWARANGSWVYVQATGVGLSSYLNSVRSQGLYARAVEAGAVGFVFSLPTASGTWRTVTSVDRPFAAEETRYARGERPIPCFAVDREDGARIARALETGGTLRWEVDYDPRTRWEGLNVVARMEGTTPGRTVVCTHLDGFYEGANDNASGLATTVGVARRLAARPRAARRHELILTALCAHHDSGAGMRSFVTSMDPADVDGWILLEHTDAGPGADPPAAWPVPLNDYRIAFVGPRGWPELESALPDLVRASGISSRTLPAIQDCIGDLHVVCEDARRAVCVIQAPPYYHTDHDTMDKLSREGLEAATEFHVALLAAAGAIASS